MSGFDRVWPGPRRRRSAAPGRFTSATRAVAVGLAAVSLLLAAACDIRVRVPRTMWSYHYEEGDLNDSRRIFLFVYFDEDERYDGYMWFSSFPK